jgi:outer membrane protein insertion porin family
MESLFSSYRLVSRGVSVGVDLYPLADVKQSVTWQGAWRDLNCLGTETPFSIREEAGHTLKSSVRYSLYKDTRDLAMMPSFGTFWKLSTEVSGLGGDVGFLQHGIDFQVAALFFPYAWHHDIQFKTFWPRGNSCSTSVSS